MRTKIYSTSRSPETANVYLICDAMDWNFPTFKNRTKDGYICKWGGRSMVGHTYQMLLDDGMDKAKALKSAWDAANLDVAEIYERTGILCRLTPSGHLVIPYGEE